LDLLQDSQ